jgi:phosphoserine phosphatase
LASAAVDIVAEPFARLLRFDDVVATRTEWDVSGKATGGFVGLNCYGDEKLVRVKTLLGESAPPRSAAYSDHVTDVPLLTWAHTGYAVNPHRPLAEVAAAHGLIVLDLDAPPNKADAV